MKPPLAWLLAAGMSASCEGSGPSAPDAAPDAAPADSAVTAERPPPPDAPPSAQRYAPCTAPAQCPPGGTCLPPDDGYPGGYCSRACADDADCGPDGLCAPYGDVMRCFLSCDSRRDCRPGYQCFQVGYGRPATDRACYPFCDDDGQCAPLACNRWSRFCGVLDPTRAENGGPCRGASDCLGDRCLREFNNDGSPTGRLDGICTSRCNVPADAAYAGATLPRGDCPEGSVCTKDPGAAAGTVATCRVACRADGDCRVGYVCVRPSRPGGGSYENGYCDSMNCHYMAQRCPDFASCRTTATDDAGAPTRGFCVRHDGGVDAAADGAGVDAAGDL